MGDPNPNQFSVFLQGIEASFTVVPVASNETEFQKTTIKELKTKIVALRPELTVDSLRLLFAGKQLEELDEYKQACTLESYNIRGKSTIHAVLRMHGETTRDKIPRPASPNDKVHSLSDISLKFTTLKPDYPNSLTVYCRSLVDQNHFEMFCPAIVDATTNKQCKTVWEYVEVRQVALLNEDECHWFESKIAERAAQQYCDMKECPGCRSFVERDDLHNLRVCCTICSKKKGSNYDFCWQCLHEWSGPTTSSVKCGRAECEHPDMPSIRDAPDMTLNGKSVPNRRACPTCGKIAEHNGIGCKMIMCTRLMGDHDPIEFSVLVQGIEASFTVVPVATNETEFNKTTIKQLKTKIATIRSELTVDSLRLLFAGKQLEELIDNKQAATLEFYKIRGKSTIHAVVRMKTQSTSSCIVM
eukprot:Em0047g32a